MRTVTLLWCAIAKDRSLQREEWQGMHSLTIPRLVEKALLLMRNAYRILLGNSIHAISSLYILCWKRQFSMLWFGCIACLLFRSRFDIWILLWITKSVAISTKIQNNHVEKLRAQGTILAFPQAWPFVSLADVVAYMKCFIPFPQAFHVQPTSLIFLMLVDLPTIPCDSKVRFRNCTD